MRADKNTSLAGTQVSTIIAGVIAIVMVVGCASTEITNREQFVTGKLPKPAHIWVYDFSATPADVPANSAIASQVAENPSPQTEQEIAAGRELGHQIAAQLVQEINTMGMPAMLAAADAAPQINDIILRGALISSDEGSAAKRVTIGLGAGTSQLSTAVEGFQMTPEGLRPLAKGTLVSGGGKAPGAALGAATLLATGNPAGLIISSAIKVYGEASGRSTVAGRAQQTAREIATELKTRFQAQGWIQ